MASTGKNGHWIYRSAITGKLVTEEYARANPNTTTREWVED